MKIELTVQEIEIIQAILRKEESYLNVRAINFKNKQEADKARALLLKCNFLYDLQNKINKQITN